MGLISLHEQGRCHLLDVRWESKAELDVAISVPADVDDIMKVLLLFMFLDMPR